MQNPIVYDEKINETYFKEIADYIKTITNKTLVFAIEYLENETQIILSYYTFEQLKLTNHLLVLDNKTGEFLYTDIINNDRNGIGFDTFVVVDRALIYVKNGTSLISIQLNTFES
jgi:hypothetical protein